MITMNIDAPCLKGLMVHCVGSKNNAEALHISNDSLELDTETMKLLQDGFLYKFKTIPEQYSFHHTSSLQFNEVYSFCRQLFSDVAQLPS
ncbi:MAG: hypothetical protein ACTHMD_08905, partial [Flavisolibacter sp.]